MDSNLSFPRYIHKYKTRWSDAKLLEGVAVVVGAAAQKLITSKSIRLSHSVVSVSCSGKKIFRVSKFVWCNVGLSRWVKKLRAAVVYVSKNFHVIILVSFSSSGVIATRSACKLHKALRFVSNTELIKCGLGYIVWYGTWAVDRGSS